MANSRFKLGPATFVAAAFIGPGTVTTATLAGANYGYVLSWGILFSIFATIVLQEMAARLGVVGRLSLGEAIRTKIPKGIAFTLAATLIVAAIFIGNAAYEGGNLSGAALGASYMDAFGLSQTMTTVFLGVLAAGLLLLGRFNVLKNVLAAVVALLSLVYLFAAFTSGVDWAAALSGLLPLRLPEGSELTLIALIGTTVVPYNLFLHASAARDHYAAPDELQAARMDTYVSVLLGGLITLAISLTAAAAFPQSYGTVVAKTLGSDDLLTPLRGVLGVYAPYVLGIGYLAAGLSSAITAPLASAYAMVGLFGWSADMKSARFRMSWAVVLLVGLGFSLTGIKPVSLIFLAQVANGILLPIIAGFLLWVVNDRDFLGSQINGRTRNILGLLVLAITVLLSGRSLWLAFGF
ncbi:MAG: Nramp family divalent metal transporter [Saprospiraceae bacterium]